MRGTVSGVVEPRKFMVKAVAECLRRTKARVETLRGNCMTGMSCGADGMGAWGLDVDGARRPCGHGRFMGGGGGARGEATVRGVDLGREEVHVHGSKPKIQWIGGRGLGG